MTIVVVGEHQPLLWSTRCSQQQQQQQRNHDENDDDDAAVSGGNNSTNTTTSNYHHRCCCTRTSELSSVLLLLGRKSLWYGGIGMTILVTLLAFYYTSTVSVSFHTTNSKNMNTSSSMTEQERFLLNHYYGPYMTMALLLDASSSSSSSSSSILHQQFIQPLRTAQQMADTALQELNHVNDLDTTTTTTTTPEDNEKKDPPPPNRHTRQRRALLHHDQKKHHHDHHDDDTSKPRLPPPPPPPPPVGCETTVVLIRHCEKELIAEHCAYNGYERSVYLSTLFGDSITSKYPKPFLIYAESPISRNTHSHKMNFREVETVGPLSELLHVPVDDSYTDDTIHDLAHHLKHHIKEGQYCGQVIVIAWKHTSIATLAHTLGCGPVQGCPIDYSGKTFDQLWQVRYVYTNEFTHSTHKHHFLQHPAEHVYWKVFGSMQYENFDPLAFSKLRGHEYDDKISSSSSSSSNKHWNDSNEHDEPLPPLPEELPLLYSLSKSEEHNNPPWQEDVVSYPERLYSTDTAGWKMTMLGASKHSDPLVTVP